MSSKVTKLVGAYRHHLSVPWPEVEQLLTEKSKDGPVALQDVRIARIYF